MGVALELVGGLIAEEFHAVAAFDQRLTFGGEAFEFDRADFGAVLFFLAALLRLLVVVQLALDPADGAVEEIDHRPEQILEVGFEAGVHQGDDEGVEDVGDAPVTLWASGSGLGSGSSSWMRWAAARSRCRHARSSWCFPSSDRPRPSRPSWRRKAAGGQDLHPKRSEGPKRSGGWRGPAILPRDVKAGLPADGK